MAALREVIRYRTASALRKETLAGKAAISEATTAWAIVVASAIEAVSAIAVGLVIAAVLAIVAASVTEAIAAVLVIAVV